MGTREQAGPAMQKRIDPGDPVSHTLQKDPPDTFQCVGRRKTHKISSGETMKLQQKSKIRAASLIIIVAVATILIAGCTDAPHVGQKTTVSDGARQGGQKSVTLPATSPAARQTGTVSPVPTTPACAYPPLNPWTWVPESYSSSGKMALPPAPGILVSKADLFGTPSLKWDEYEYSQQIKGLPDSYGTSRMTKTVEMNNGLSVIHENHTYGLHLEGTTGGIWDATIDDMYYDTYGNMQSMHRRVIKDGRFLEDRDYPPVDMNRGTPDCTGEIFSPGYTYLGTDFVTVPAGAYPDAMKYSQKNADDPEYSKNTTTTYWFAHEVPVPVKWVINDPDKGLLFTYELKGWG
jgi:hypothetical protein